MWTLILLSFAMLVGCYLAGAVPLAFNLSDEKLRLVSVLGAGLLVGTALAVIIPEGVHALLFPSGEHREGAAHVVAKEASALPGVGGVVALTGGEHKEDIKLEPAAAAGATHQHEHESGVELHSWIGVALVLGFVFMLLVDQIGGHMHAHAGASEPTSAGQNRNKITATLGLVVHAAADGIALGAAASTSQTHVEIIVFIAIMLHKAPAAFGLVSFLLHEGFDRTRIRRHLSVFALSAPVLAIVTYMGLNASNKDVLVNNNATGIAMLFSGGTFLYVATVHILPRLARVSISEQLSGSSGEAHVGFSKVELALMVSGCLLPLILALGHKH